MHFFFSVIIQPLHSYCLLVFCSRLQMFRLLWEGVENSGSLRSFSLRCSFNSVAWQMDSVSDESLSCLRCGDQWVRYGARLIVCQKPAPADRLTDASIRQCGYRFNSILACCGGSGALWKHLNGASSAGRRLGADFQCGSRSIRWAASQSGRI